MASAIVFGGSFMAVVAAVGVFVRRATPAAEWTRALALLTMAFGLGQCVGPWITGMLSDGPTGVSAGLWLSVGILAASMVVAACERGPADRS